jgi:hypothetical protein
MPTVIDRLKQAASDGSSFRDYFAAIARHDRLTTPRAAVGRLA